MSLKEMTVRDTGFLLAEIRREMLEKSGNVCCVTVVKWRLHLQQKETRFAEHSTDHNGIQRGKSPANLCCSLKPLVLLSLDQASLALFLMTVLLMLA